MIISIAYINKVLFVIKNNIDDPTIGVVIEAHSNDENPSIAEQQGNTVVENSE